MQVEENIEKRESKGLPVWACILLFALGAFLCMGLYGTVIYGMVILILGGPVQNGSLSAYMIAETVMLLSVLTSATILLYFEKRPFSDLGLSLKGHVKGIWYGLLIAVLLYLAGFGLSLLIGDVEVTGFQLDLPNLLASWLFFLLVALTEEIMMRGYILGRLLHTPLNKFLSLFISAALFALLHISNPNVAFLPMLNLVFAGLMLGASYLYTRNLCFPISLHLFWNWIQGPVLGYQVSGNDFTSSLLTLHMSEENVLNGGAFGFEGSLICTVLMIVLTIAIIWWGEKKEAISLAVPRSC